MSSYKVYEKLSISADAIDTGMEFKSEKTLSMFAWSMNVMELTTYFVSADDKRIQPLYFYL